jgi:hypothetical protein
MFGLVSRFDNIRGPQTANRLSEYISSDSAGFANTDIFSDSWSSLFDLLGPTKVKSSGLPTDSHEYMFGLYNWYNLTEQQIQFSPNTLPVVLAGFSNCDDQFAVNCRTTPQTQYRPTGHNILPGFHTRDYYHLDLAIPNRALFNQQVYLDQVLANPNVNSVQGVGQDLNFGSFLVRSNIAPCDDNDPNTLDVRNGALCSYTNIAVTPPPAPSVVPEPSILAFFGIGIVGLGLRRRRKQAKG